MLTVIRNWESLVLLINDTYYPICHTCNEPILEAAQGNFAADGDSCNWQVTHKGPCTPRVGPWYGLVDITGENAHRRIDTLYSRGMFGTTPREQVIEIMTAVARCFEPVRMHRPKRASAGITSPLPRYRGVYVIKCQDRYKIGKAKNIASRVQGLASIMPFDTEFICGIYAADETKLENKLHARFAAKRVKGEWFELDDSDVAYLLSL